MHAWLHVHGRRLAVNVSSKSPLSSVGSGGIRTQEPSEDGTKSPCIHRNRVSYQSRHWDIHKMEVPVTDLYGIQTPYTLRFDFWRYIYMQLDWSNLKFLTIFIIFYLVNMVKQQYWCRKFLFFMKILTMFSYTWVNMVKLLKGS